ncbi:hypothetical protein DFH09DRAFT_1284521 [Mycena vulgaris]|nr:hypothetical protein DFH09DRAFT_1284521 [Mycena vulgaris]
MSFESLSSAAGQSATTLQALSEYCASSDSPNSSFAQSDSSYSFTADIPLSSSPESVPELADVLMESDRFQSTHLQEKMLKALKYSTGSGFTRPAPSTSSRRRDRVVSSLSTQGMYEGLPPSPSDCFFNDTSLAETSTPLRVGLGLLAPSATSNEPRLLSPLPSGCVTPEPSTNGFDPAGAVHTPPRGQPVQPSEQPTSAESTPSSRYRGLGNGLPSYTTTMTSAHLVSGFTISSTRSISQLLGVVPSASSSYALLNGMPSLARRPQIKPPRTLRLGTTNLVQTILRKISAFDATPRQDARNGMKKLLAAVGRFLIRR